LKAPRIKLFKLKYDEPLSNFAFKFKLRRYIKGKGSTISSMLAAGAVGPILVAPKLAY